MKQPKVRTRTCLSPDWQALFCQPLCQEDRAGVERDWVTTRYRSHGMETPPPTSLRKVLEQLESGLTSPQWQMTFKENVQLHMCRNIKVLGKEMIWGGRET